MEIAGGTSLTIDAFSLENNTLQVDNDRPFANAKNILTSTGGKLWRTRQRTANSLHDRVNDYLRGNPVTFAVEESEAVTIEAIFDQLNKAEEDLKTMQERVDRLRWELAKAKS